MSMADFCQIVSIRMRGLTENFFEEIKTLPLEDENDEMASFSSARGGRSGRGGRGGRGGMRGPKKRKVYKISNMIS